MNLQTSTNQTIGPYVIRSEIGRGSFAIVYKGKHTETNRVISIKSVLTKKLTKKLLENLESEISILKEIRHVHVVELIDCIKAGRFIHLVMEYCSLGDLSYFIRKREKFNSIPSLAWINIDHPPVYKAGLNETLVRHFTQQLASALQFLRSRSLIHRDVKPQNLLLQPPPTAAYLEEHPQFVGSPKLPMLKLADFGFARYLQTSSMAETLCGSPLYMAPEILRYEKYDAKADLWSVGAVLYEMAVGKPPFKAPNHVELLRRIQKAKDVIKFPEEAFIHPDIKTLICALLKQNPADRIDYDGFFSSIVVTTPLDDASTLTGSDIQDAVKEINIPSSSPAYITDFFPKSNPGAPAPPGGLLRQAFQAQGSSIQPSEITGRRVPHRYAQDGNTLPYTPVFPPESAPAASIFPPRLTSKQPIPMASPAKLTSDTSNKSSAYVVVDHHPIISSTQLSNESLTHEQSINGNSPSPNEGVFQGSFSPESAPVNNHAFPHTSRMQIPYMKPNAFPSNPTYIASTPVTQLRRAFEQATAHVPQSGGGTRNKSALERALNVANARLNEVVVDGMTDNGNTSLPTKESNLDNNVNIIQPSLPDTGKRLLDVLESIAMKSNSVYHLAEVKLAQIIPSLSDEMKPGDTLLDRPLTPFSLVMLAKESYVLYERDIELLQVAFDGVAAFWANSEERASPDCQQAIEWFRQRYSESLEKSQFLREIIISQSAAHSLPTTKPVSASQLIYHRALDLSRNAATSELSGNDAQACLQNYRLAAHLLESLLESNFSTPDGANDSNNSVTIRNLIALITKRQELLQSKQIQANVANKVTESVAKITLAPNLA